MTTSDKAKVHVSDKFFDELFAAPGLREHVHAQAAKVADLMQAAWPEGASELTEDSAGFSHTGAHSKVIEVHDSTRDDGRPVSVIGVHHPYAAAHQAKTGFVTQAVRAAGLKLNSESGG